MSLQGSCENCTPKSGPPGVKSTPGGKCSCTIKLAVRAVKAWPRVLRNEPVPAFEIAASSEGTRTPSSPQLLHEPFDPMTVSALAPAILKTPSTLPSLSTTAIVALRLLASARVTACAMTVRTSLAARRFALDISSSRSTLVDRPSGLMTFTVTPSDDVRLRDPVDDYLGRAFHLHAGEAEPHPSRSIERGSLPSGNFRP